MRPDGETGRHRGLKIPSLVIGVGVRIPLWASFEKTMTILLYLIPIIGIWALRNLPPTA